MRKHLNQLTGRCSNTQIKGLNNILPQYPVSLFLLTLLNINTLRTSKSFGPDKIPIGLLKDCKEVITAYLTHIFSQSLTLGIFPDD